MTRSRFICCCLCALQLALSPAAGAWTQQRLAERFGLNGTEIRPDALLDRRASKMTPAAHPVPAGKYDIELQAVDQSSNTLFCVEATLNL